MSKRISYLALLLLVVFAIILMAEDSVRPSLKTGKNWPPYRGDAHSRGVAHPTLPDKPDRLWVFEVKDGAFESTATIADGVVYIGDMDGKLFALDLASGKEIWSQKFAAGFIAAPAVRNGLLYLGDMDGKCYCIEAKTGKPKWSFAAEAEVDSSANF